MLDRLEEEANTVSDELRERRYRRLEVGHHLPPHGHNRMCTCHLEELVERRFDGAAAGAAHGRSEKVGAVNVGAAASDAPKARKKQLRSPVWQAPAPSWSTTNRSVSPSQS